MVVTLLDFVVTPFPFRAFHVIYVWAYAWIYALASYIVAQIDPARNYFKQNLSKFYIISYTNI